MPQLYTFVCWPINAFLSACQPWLHEPVDGQAVPRALSRLLLSQQEHTICSYRKVREKCAVQHSGCLQEFQDTTKRLRRVYKRLQPLREEEGQPDQAEPGQAAVSMVADATAAGHADLASDPEALQLCFNGGQVGCDFRPCSYTLAIARWLLLHLDLGLPASPSKSIASSTMTTLVTLLTGL